MSLIVQKFGGSSLRDTTAILHAAHIIKKSYDDGNDVIAVVSAQGKTTDRLITQAGELHPSPPVRELDALLATGEQASAALCAMALDKLGVPAVSLCAWQVPVETDGVFQNARITAVGKTRILQLLKERKVVIVAGFQGVSRCDDTVTLGRGGSDTTAVALAAALNADICRIYTDVDGVFTTDPTVCPQAKQLPRISYDHMLLLASRGAQVLHDRSVELAAHYAVPLEVRSCQEGSLGTRILDFESGEPFTGVTQSSAGTSALARITVVGEALPSVLAMRSAVSAMENDRITVCGIEEGEKYFSVYVSHEDANRTLCCLHRTFFHEE